MWTWTKQTRYQDFVTTWKIAGGIEIDVALEVKLVTTLKSGGGIENDVVLDVA